MNMELGFDLAAAAPSPTPPAPQPAEPAADKPRIWTVFVTWFVTALVGQMVVIAMFLVAAAAIALVLVAQGADPGSLQPRITAVLTQPVLALILSIVPFQLTMLLAVVLVAQKSTTPFRERVGLLSPQGRPFSRLTLAGLAACTLSLGAR